MTRDDKAAIATLRTPTACPNHSPATLDSLFIGHAIGNAGWCEGCALRVVRAVRARPAKAPRRCHSHKGRSCCRSSSTDRHAGTRRCGRRRRHDLFPTKPEDCPCWTCVKHGFKYDAGLNYDDLTKAGGQEVLFLCGGCGAELKT